MLRLGMAGLMAAAVLGLAAGTPALAQGTLSPQKKPSWGNTCAENWTDRASQVNKITDVSSPKGDTCYPMRGAKPAFAPTSNSTPCPNGYTRSGSFCHVGEKRTVTSTAGSVNKAHPLDRCPVAYFTYGDGSACTSLSPNPPTVRLKGEGDCNPGEVEDWGLWCVSNYEGLARKDATKGIADYNGIYQASFKATSKQQGPRQPDLPEGGGYTPAYFVIFGRVDKDGNPLPGSGAQATTMVADATTNPASAAESAVKQCVPKPKKKKGLGGLLKDAAAELGVPTGEGC